MANQPDSLAVNLETWGIAVLVATGVFPVGYAIDHYSALERANMDRVTVRATIGDRELAGFDGWNVALEIAEISVTLSESVAASYDAAIDDAMDNPSTVAELELFSALVILPPEAEQKEASSNTRERTRVFNFLALESEAVYAYLRPDATSIFLRPDGTARYLRPAA